MQPTSAFILASVIVTAAVCSGSLDVSAAGSSSPIWSGNGSEGKFIRYARIFPILLHNSDFPATDGDGHTSNGARGRLSISYELAGSNVTLDLRLNDDIVPAEHFFSIQKDGVDRIRLLQENEIEMCHYHGLVRNQPDSYVALSTCDGISGVVYDSNGTYLIQSETIDAERAYFIYKPQQHDISARKKREIETMNDAPVESILAAYRANQDSNYVELVLVIDNSLYRHNSNEQRLHKYCLQLVNIMNAIYRPLNIYIALVGVVVWSDRDAIEISHDSKQTLDNFLEYRRNTLLKMIPHDNAHLLTKVRFESSVVGKAEMGSMCTYAGSGGVEVMDTGNEALFASTVAHEMGHNFNIDHDDESCSCPGRSCIMAEKTNWDQMAPRHWSSCSIKQLETGLKHGLGSCLKNKPRRMVVSSTCGNGLIEPGEECDCGLSSVCDTKCCDPATCRLTVNSTCAAGDCCDLNTCQVKSAGVKCRAATGECDLPEYCDGQTALCPKDVYLRDTVPCGGEKAYCYQGKCRSRDSQCKVLWGPSARSIDEVCYQSNLNGSVFGNCGYNWETGTYDKCSKEDMLCGLLHCEHKNEKLNLGIPAYSKLTSTMYSRYGPRGTVRPITCNTAIIDLGLAVTNPGLVPDGAKCGTGKMCWKQKCVSLTHLQENDIGEDCAEGCNGHGICNSEGNCHCEVGYGGQFCEKSGIGGSIDSGPVIYTDDSKALSTAIYASFTILILIAIAAFAYRYVNFFKEQLHQALIKFRMRKYGHMVPPASPTRVAPAKPPRLEISEPTLHTTTSANIQVPNQPDVIPTRAAPAPPSLKTEPGQHFIKVNINNSGKITIENKVINSPFLLSSPLLDAHEAIHEIKARGPPAIFDQRSISMDSEHSLLNNSDQQPVDTPPILDGPNHDLGMLISQVKLKKVQDFQTNRSKSDERPTRQLPQLPRQKTIGEFQNVVAEIHPKRSPATEQPPSNPFAEVTLKKVKPRTPNLSRENLDEITKEQPLGIVASKKLLSTKPLPKPEVTQQKPVVPQSRDNRFQEPPAPQVAVKPKPVRKLPQIPTAGVQHNRPPLVKKPTIKEDGVSLGGSTGSVAALKAKLNLEQISGGIKR